MSIYKEQQYRKLEAENAELWKVIDVVKRADDSATDEEGVLAYWSADCRAIKRALAAFDEVVG